MKQLQMKTVNLILMPGFILLCGLFFIAITEYKSVEDLQLQKEIYAIVLIIFNFGVLAYHWLVDAPPKFYLRKQRRFALFTHLLGGTLILFFSVIAYTSSSPGWAIAAALATLLMHVPAALYQTPEVYGAKGIMVPVYIVIIMALAFFAVRVLLEPADMVRVLDLFLTLNIYVFCRIIYMAFEQTGLFPYSRYTAAIMVSGFLIGPAIFGPLGNLAILLFIIVDVSLFEKLMGFTAREKQDLMLEHSLQQTDGNMIKPALNRHFARKKIISHPDYSAEQRYTEKELAKLFFEILDEDKDGALNLSEWSALSESWEIRSDLEKLFFTSISENKLVSFESFYEKVWRMGLHVKDIPSAEELKELSSAEKAHTVFKQLDIYNEDSVTPLALSLLLAEWGLRPLEIAEFVNQYPDGVTEERFHDELSVIWQYYASH
jgi:hypothetical protein